MNVIDLFAGCGGISLGFIQAGYTLKAAFDNWEAAVSVYRKNFAHPIFNNDLRLFEGDTTLFTQFKPDMIIGGPPCQDFSSAGKRDETLGRANLTYIFADIVLAIQPQWFVMENVDRVLKTKTYRYVYQQFQTRGYGLSQVILDASLCGVPQKRKRLFLIGELGGSPEAMLAYLKCNLAQAPLTVRQYLGEQLEIEHYYRHPRSYKRRGIFSIDEPSPTVRGVNRPLPEGYPGHSGDTAPVSTVIRALTTYERSLLQTFPETFIWQGSKTDLEQMIGNAVPVKLAKYVAEEILRYQHDGLAGHSVVARQMNFFDSLSLI